MGTLPPVQYSTQKIPEILNIQKTMILSLYLHNPKPTPQPHPVPSPTKKKLKNDIRTKIVRMIISMVKIFVQRNFSSWKTTFL